jgi:hypothetical protein
MWAPEPLASAVGAAIILMAGRPPMKAGRLLIAGILVISILGVAAEAERRASVRAKYSKARAQIADFQLALRRYYEDNGSYPTTDQGILALGEY